MGKNTEMTHSNNAVLLTSALIIASALGLIEASSVGKMEAFCSSPIVPSTRMMTVHPDLWRQRQRWQVNISKKLASANKEWNGKGMMSTGSFEKPANDDEPKEAMRDYESDNHLTTTRRSLLSSILISTTSVAGAAVVNASPEEQQQKQEETTIFRSSAYGREEYTNSIIASRDTNISPKEVYDTIAAQLRYPLTMMSNDEQAKRKLPRALDVGAGAGLSTQILWDLGYRSIDAIDWTREAWDTYVTSCPSSVSFYELDDERYIDQVHQKDDKFDVIAFNFGINESKAKQFTKLLKEPYGRLLAPVNAQTNYWLKQTYKAYDCNGNVLWSAMDVGAWSVQFQPDVTEETCQGVWCAPYNGFQKKKR